MAKVTRKTKEVVEIHMVLSPEEYSSLMCYLNHEFSRHTFYLDYPFNASTITQLRSDLAAT